MQACHVALSEPQRYLGGFADAGAGSGDEDACIAYKLFLTVRRMHLSRVTPFFHNLAQARNTSHVVILHASPPGRPAMPVLHVFTGHDKLLMSTNS